MGMKDLELSSYQLAVPCRKTVYLQGKQHFLRFFVLVLCSVTFWEFLACCASMNEMPRVKSEDEIRRDLGVGRFIFKLVIIWSYLIVLQYAKVYTFRNVIKYL